MSDRVEAFLCEWICNNVRATDLSESRMEARRLAALCIADAEKQGIKRSQLEEEVDLMAMIDEAIDNANMERLDRFASKTE